VLRLVPGQENREAPEKIATVEMPFFAEMDAVVKPLDPADTPHYGGSLTIYSDRAFTDEIMGSLVTATPFSQKPDSARGPAGRTGYLSAGQVSARKVRVSLNQPLVNAAGRRITAFDIADTWSNLAKNFPLDGKAAFGSVKGFAAFIRGEEAVIPGLQLRDDNTIILNLERDDPDAVVRLEDRRLLAQNLMLGPYAAMRTDGTKMTLVANRSCAFDTAYADSITLVPGGDRNPLVSFSLNRYDVVTMVFNSDIDYAKKSLLKDAYIAPYETDRYFLSCAVQDEVLRRCIAGAIDARELLAGLPRIDAAPIHAVETDDSPAPPALLTNAGTSSCAPVTGAQPLRILFQSDDPLSVRIAEKLLARLTQAGFECRLAGSAIGRFQKYLYNGEYDIAAGWTEESAPLSARARLRLAEAWFGGMSDETQRIREGYEIALFSVKRYALCKNRVGLSGGFPAGVYIRK
jgi:hypothetical protein